MNALLQRDDMGYPLALASFPTRVVSLVPSLTEAIAATEPALLVGATDWCAHPAGLVVPRVRGTKNPNRAAIIDLQPDLVVANKEENRRSDVAALRAAGVPVWVTVIETVDEALRSLRRLITQALGLPAPRWLDQASEVWQAPAPARRRSVIIPIWRDPWMVIGRSTFAGDLAARLGLDNLYAPHSERYPHVVLSELQDHRADLVLLPDEPYPFAASDGPEAFPDRPVALVRGRDLTWYGPSLTTARITLLHQIDQALGGG